MPTTTGTERRSLQWVENVARFGLFGKAVLHLVIGFLAFQLAKGTASADADSTGAVQWIDEQPWGTPVLLVLAASLACLAVWRGIDAFTGDPVEGSGMKERVTFGAKAVFYSSVAFAPLPR